MPGAFRRRVAFALALALALAAVWGARSAHAEAEIEEPEAPAVIKEWVGLELTPASFSLTQGRSEPGEGSSRLQAGPGGNIRLFRHRWERAYVIPIQAGVYVASGDDVIFAHVQTEGGVVVQGTDRRFEIGMGAGIGVLAIKYGNHCDGYCYTGGAGAMVSLVARYLFLSTPTATVGASLRALIPLETPSTQVFGGISSWGSAVLAGLEIGFGRTRGD